jgi:hypothetical protein
MKRILLSFFVLLIALSIQAQPRELPDDVAVLYVKLDFPDTVPLVLQTALFEENPFQIYDTLVTNNKAFIESQFSPTDDTTIMQNKVVSAMTFYWDQVFQSVSGFEVSMITSRPDDFISYTIKDPEEQMWIVTKTSFFNGYFVIWSLPIQIKGGKEYEVVMNKENYLDLTGLFSYIMAGKPKNPNAKPSEKQ